MELAVGGGPAPGGPEPDSPIAVLLGRLAALENAIADQRKRTEAVELENQALRTDLLAAQAGGPVTGPAGPQASTDDPIVLVNRLPVPFEYMWGGIAESIPASGRTTVPRWKAEHARGKARRWLSPDDDVPLYLIGLVDAVLGVEKDTDALPEELAIQFIRSRELMLFPKGYAPRKSIEDFSAKSDFARHALAGPNVGAAVASVNA